MIARTATSPSDVASFDQTALLEVRNLEVAYHRVVRAVQGISLSVLERSIVGIVGSNGAGKTTTLGAIAGFLSTDDVAITDGRITFVGRDCTREKPYVMSRLGIALVPERDKIFPRMRTEENLIASVVGTRGAEGVDIDISEVYELFPLLRERSSSVAGYLSGGERQMLAMGMALLGRPRLLLVDEFSLGLAPVAVQSLVVAIKRMHAEFGISVLFVEQSAVTALDLADYIYVMENGRIVFEGSAESVAENPDFRDYYLALRHGAEERSYRDVRQYSKKRRWFG